MLVQCDGKICPRCLEFKSFSNYYKNKSRKDGLSGYCKSCHWKSSHSSPNRKKVAASYHNKKKLENPALFMWKRAKHRAQYDYGGIEFSITVEDIVIPKFCPYLNVPFDNTTKDFAYSLDRIDSSKGYTKDNIRVISVLANIMKNKATEEQLIAFANGVLRVHSKEGQLGC
jgi:hypothetical protein